LIKGDWSSDVCSSDLQQVVAHLARWGGQSPKEVVGREERVFFTLPRELRRADSPEEGEVPEHR
jgi:hypothetical protein